MERESSSNMGLLQKKYGEDSGRLTRWIMTQFYNTLDRMLGKVQADTVFDAGCGEGHIMDRFLTGRYPLAAGMDLDPERLHYALAHNASLDLIHGNLHHLPLADSSVDLVTCLEVLEHVGEPERTLRELHRVTGRYAILSVPNEPFWRIANMARGAYWSEWGNTPEHINHWSVWGFRRFVSQYFTVLDTANPVTWTFVLAEKR